MKKDEHRKRATVICAAALVIAAVCLLVGILKTNAYNNAKHRETFSGPGLFAQEDEKATDVSVVAVARSSTWGKIFDFDHVGLTENNYQAYTYDFTVSNNTKDEVRDFRFKLTFGNDAFLASAWNGALEIHQNVKGGEMVATVPDLREFVPGDYDLEVVTVDGESFIAMKAGDYLVYLPSSSMNAMEMPIEPFEGTTPGIIMYVEMGRTIEDSSLELEYSFHRLLTSEPLFWISIGLLGLWLIALVIFLITSAQIKKYKERHERPLQACREVYAADREGVRL